MKNKIPLQNIDEGNVQIVYSKGVFNYEKVLDDNSDFIKILTYNISKEDEDLLGKLNSYDEVTLITNIPNRYTDYYSEKARERAKDYIDNYLDKLNPLNFDNRIRVFFYFANHSKVLMNENVAYIGSSNFSSESKKNFECGVLIQDKKVLNSINKQIFNEITSEAIQYYGPKISKLKVLFKKFTNELENIQEIILYSSYDYIEHAGNKREIFSIHDIGCFSEGVKELHFLIYNMEDRMNEIFQFIKGSNIKIDISFIKKIREVVKEIQKLINRENPVFKIANFNRQDYISDYLEKNYRDVVEETLGDYQQKASEEAMEIINDLERKAKEYVEQLEERLAEVLNHLKKVPEFLTMLQENYEEQIDNT